MKAVVFDEEVLRPCPPLARPEMTRLAPHQEALEPSPDVRVDLIELVRGVYLSLKAFDIPLGTRRSLLAPGTCYPALRRLPGGD
jgi:hypothetical protein